MPEINTVTFFWLMSMCVCVCVCFLLLIHAGGREDFVARLTERVVYIPSKEKNVKQKPNLEGESLFRTGINLS